MKQVVSKNSDEEDAKCAATECTTSTLENAVIE